MSAIHAAEMRRCLESLDVAGARKLWAHDRPNMPQPKTDREALMMLHYARTQMDSMKFDLRAYSHRWLCDNGFPSGMPDALKPKAERVYPKIVSAVGIAVSSSIPEIAEQVQTAMSNAVLEAYADGNKDPAFVSARMAEAKNSTMKKLVGRLGR